MAYEVIKRVGARAYRYRVESLRDPDTHKVKSRWTYLGRVENTGTLSAAYRAKPKSRERLLTALDDLFEAGTELDTGRIAAAADLAYGTFYRYFNNLTAIVQAGLLRHEADFAPVFGPDFVAASAAGVPAEVFGAWLDGFVAQAQSHPGRLRAWLINSSKDALLIAARTRIEALATDTFAQYLAALQAAGTAVCRHPRSTAYLLTVLCTTILRDCALGIPIKLHALTDLMCYSQ